MSDEFDIAVYAPSFSDGDVRALATIHGMERAFPDAPLKWEIDKKGIPVALPDRDRWLIDNTRGGGLPLLCNGDESYPVVVSGRDVSGYVAPAHSELTFIHSHLPFDERVVAAAEALLEGVGDGARAYWGVASPARTTLKTIEQTIHPEIPGHPSPPRPQGLPGLKRSFELVSPVIPDRLGWLNYWSSAAAEIIGFTDPARDEDLFFTARQTPGGAWLVRLSEEPLDLDIPAHLEALARAYDRFPVIGGREDPGQY